MIFIDSDNYKASGIETLFFPGGEPHAKVPEFEGIVILYLKLRTWNDVGIAACVLDALSRNGKVQVFVGLMYFPGARQDKGEGGKYPLTAQLMILLLHKPVSKFKYFVFDHHSNYLSQNMFFERLDFTHLNIHIQDDVRGILSPDAGAMLRAHAFRDWYYPGLPVICCNKIRNQKTGDLSNYQMPGLPSVGRYIIVDDICDGGGTFNLLAHAFSQDPLSSECNLELFVSHGIFSKGLSNIYSRIEHITTTDSWCKLHWTVDNDRLTVLPLADLLKQAVKLKLG